MRTITKIFGRSPFIPLQMHMEKVAECVNKIPKILAAYRGQDVARVKDLAYVISRTEHEADLIKNDIRKNLRRGLFMPIDRGKLLRILDIQDSIANRAENIGVLLTFKQAGTFAGFETAFDGFVEKCLESFDLARSIVGELDELLETGFGGPEAQSVHAIVDRVAKTEYEADVLQRELVRTLFANEHEISYGDFYLWTRVIRQIAGLADRADDLASAISVTLESR